MFITLVHDNGYPCAVNVSLIASIYVEEHISGVSSTCIMLRSRDTIMVRNDIKEVLKMISNAINIPLKKNSPECQGDNS